MAGATWDVVVLSSSPPAPAQSVLSSPQDVPPRRRVALLASSPPMFSPPASPKQRTTGASKVNLRAAAIPEGAVRGFATVNTLVQSAYFSREQEDDQAGTKQAQPPEDSLEGTKDAAKATKKPRKPPVKKPVSDGTDKPKAKPRGRKPKSEQYDPAQDPELRLPGPSKSSFFGKDAADAAPKADGGSEQADQKLTKTGKPRKPRTKKQKAEDGEPATESKPKRTRAVKSTSVSRNAKLPPQAHSVVSSHFHVDADASASNEQDTSGNGEDQEISIPDTAPGQAPQNVRRKKKTVLKDPPSESPSKDLALEGAVARRRDWTPPAEDTATRTPSTGSIGKENAVSASGDGRTFTHLVSNFALAQSPSAQTNAAATKSSTKGAGTTKRKRVELVEIPSNHNISREPSPVKGKAPKKKPRTITNLMMDQFAPKESNLNLEPSVINSILPQGTTTKVPLNDTRDQATDLTLKKPPRKRSNSKAESDKPGSKTNTRKGAGKSKKPQSMVEKLLSPSSAMSRLERQDFLFGTSSQLALEDSPVTVRELQMAIKASEQDGDDRPNTLLAPPPRWPKLVRSEGKKSHWAASARNESGGIFEHMEDVYIPETNQPQDLPLAGDGALDGPEGQNVDVDINEIEPPPIVMISSDLPTPPQSMPPEERQYDQQSTKLVYKDIDDFDDIDQEPPPSNQNAAIQTSFMDIDEINGQTSPDAKTFAVPEAGLAVSETKTNGESPKKGPKKQAKSHSTKATATASYLSTSQSLASFQRGEAKAQSPSIAPSTLPKSVSRFVDIEEILDSEDERLEVLSPTPPRNRNKGDSPTLELVPSGPSRIKSTTKATTKAKAKPASDPKSDPALTQIFRIPIIHLQWEHIKKQVFEKLIAHIRSLPPTTDPKVPSWHERILMYEPIVLEDFTAYLNAQTNIRTYRKATQKQIKAWNKMLKKDGQAILNVDESGDEILAVEKELEPYMAQSWCESLSVCCIWKEGRGKGGARKGLY